MTTTTLSQALSAARRSYASKNPNSLKAYQQATESLPGGGTRSSIFIHPFPLFIERGEGSEIIDVDGHKYLDFVSDFTSGIYGKTNPVLKKAIIEGLDNGLQLGAHTLPESSLSSVLCSRFPSMDLIRFANSGTEANILAISTGLHYTGRKKVVVFEGGYHGSVLSHFGEDGGDLKVPYDFVVCPYNDITGTNSIIRKYAEEIGVIIVEPMLGAGGCIPGNPEFLQSLRDLSTEIGAVLVFDEVQTARLSIGGRQKILGVTPDMTTLGKFFGGGFAFGAFGGKKEIMSLFDARQPNSISHGGTFNNSPLTMIAGLTAVQHILTEENLSKLNELGHSLRENLNKVFDNEELPFEMTGLGSINQLHYTSPSQKREGLDLFFFHLLDRGYWIAQRGLVSLNFAMTESEVKGFKDAVIEAAREVKSST
ncbi:uncharacterized protein L199_001813 [Kwoniella botswanensis]|uniref:uncharacterized protein n=1 Tax=Kwoniella botswanensis TaxID=1268659 RepID=UPI00315DEC54